MELDAISQPELEQIERIGSADLVIGIFDLERQEDGSTAVAMTREALAELSMPLRAMVVCNNGSHSPSAATPEVTGDDRLSDRVFLQPAASRVGRNTATKHIQCVPKGLRRRQANSGSARAA